KLEHFTGDENTAGCGARGEGADHGAQRFGVRVIAVVESGGAAELDDLSALVAGRESFERLDGGIDIHARLESDGEPGHDIFAVMCAEQMQREIAFPMHSAEVHVQTERVFVLRENLRIGTRADAKVN